MKARFLLILFLISSIVSAQNRQDSVTSIPFVLTKHNNISVEAIFNTSDTAQLMFHLAVGGISTITNSSEKLASIKWNVTDTVGSWGGNSLSRMSANNTVQIGSLQFDSVLVAESMHSGHETDGKFGPNLFKSHFIEINFDELNISLYNYLPLFIEEYEVIPLLVENGLYFIDAKIKIENELINNRYLLHSGYSAALLFDDEFAVNNLLNEKLPLLSESELKDSFGNILKTKKSEVDSFNVGAISFSNLPISFFEGAIGRQKMSVLGMDILKRFNLLLDLENKKLYLKKSGLFDDGYIR
jgi:hypothetical protein